MIEKPPAELPQPLALAIFTHRFSTLVDVGVSLVRCLESLAECPAPYGEGADNLLQPVMDGHTLSRTMSLRPDLFSSLYVLMVRAGEVGGILEEMLQHLVRLAMREWKLASRCPPGDEPVHLVCAPAHLLPDDWSGLTPYRQTALLLLICETFGMLLGSGVPMVPAMLTVGNMFPKKQSVGFQFLSEAVKNGERPSGQLEAMGVFPRFAREMIRVGEEAGDLHAVLLKIAETLDVELECRAAVWG